MRELLREIYIIMEIDYF